ncbi:MAG: hypothetical protein GF375_06030 [Candidatus Omnitrophica bacterium]|nr:hypothetical protein [Candidatus Omnitrophota bacterium]MBD3269534.1 hypothetical protein [Candidatus Omnitrophota bacterium]
MNREKILLVCEKTGGHIFPAFAIAERLKLEVERKKALAPVIYFFSTSDFLKKYIEKKNYLSLGKALPFKNIFLLSLWRFFEALFILTRIRPNRIIGFGGRNSFFLVMVGAACGIYTAVYEPNIVLGKANLLLSKFCRRLWLGFEEGKLSRLKKSRVLGVPLRENIVLVDKDKARKVLNLEDKPVVFCFGGSQGSLFINKMFVRFVRESQKDFQFIHITGRQGYFEISRLYNKINRRNFVKDFYYDIHVLYSASDIVVSRCGASTLGEISYFGIPPVLIPHPKAGGHQKRNAYYFKEKGAAFAVSQKDFDFERFKITLEKLIDDRFLRQEVSGKVKKTGLGKNFKDFCARGLYEDLL